MNFDTSKKAMFSRKVLLILLGLAIAGAVAFWFFPSGKAGTQATGHADHAGEKEAPAEDKHGKEEHGKDEHGKEEHGKEEHGGKASGEEAHDEHGKEEGHAEEGNESGITMTDAQLKQSGVEIASAGPARIGDAVQLIGEIHLNEDRTVHVVPRLTGLVESVAVSAGDKVRKDQILAVISSQSLADQRSELLAAQKRLAMARTTLAREKQLWEEKISAEQDYQQARQAASEAEIAVESAKQKLASLRAGAASGGNLTRYEIRSPIDGTVTAKDISVGEVLKDDSSIFTVADLATVWAEMTIYAKDLNTVKVGQKAIVKATAFDSQSTGTISYVGSLVGEQTRTAKARIVLPNPEGVWRPGLPVNIDLIAGEAETPVAVAVTASAIQTLENKSTVFVREGEKFEPRFVELGRSDDQYSEVLKGLEAGEQYAAKNSFILKAEIGKGEAEHEH